MRELLTHVAILLPKESWHLALSVEISPKTFLTITYAHGGIYYILYPISYSMLYFTFAVVAILFHILRHYYSACTVSEHLLRIFIKVVLTCTIITSCCRAFFPVFPPKTLSNISLAFSNDSINNYNLDHMSISPTNI